jgi:hypothetical protein
VVQPSFGSSFIVSGKVPDTTRSTREAAKKYSPRRKSWLEKWKIGEPEGAKENFRH